MFDEKLVTVWSAPNYCYRCGNIASIMVFKDVNTREPKLFRAVPDSERVIPPRTTTPYFLWGLRPSCWPIFLPSSYPNFRVLPRTIYFLFSVTVMWRNFCLAEWRVCMHGRKATADSLLWHPSSLMKKDRIFVWFLCHWWVFLFSSSMKIYVITQISSQVISLSLCRSYKHCQLMTRSWYKEGRRSHLPPVCWKERARRIALSAQAVSSLDSFAGFHSHR